MYMGHNKNYPLVSVIIVNFNGLRFLNSCLKSVLSTDYANFEVIFIDNASTDGSVEFVKERFGRTFNLTIISNEKNLGFAEGNNVGIKIARGNYIVFLNNDTEVTQSWLRELVKVMENDYKIGIGQSKLLFLVNRKCFDSAGEFIDRYGVEMSRGGDWKEEDKGQYDLVEEIFYAKGAAMIIRRNVLDEIGLFDPLLFLTQTDADLCWRARLGGYKVVYVPKSVVYHVGEASSPALKKVFYTSKNQLLILIKNYNLCNLMKFFPFAVVIVFSTILAELLIRLRPDLAFERFKGILWSLIKFKFIWKQRVNVQYRVRKVPDSCVTKHMVKGTLAISHWLPLWLMERRSKKLRARISAGYEYTNILI